MRYSKPFKRLLLVLLCCYMGFIGGLYFMQRSQVFHPLRDTKTPAEYGLSGFENIMIPTQDHLKIQAWYKKAKPGYPTVVYFHGNAHSLGNRSNRFKEMAAAGFGVLAPTYRGYGMSEGSPTEEGLYADARGAMSYATTKLSIPSRQMILYGESLGTAVATYAATEYAVGGVILEAPPISILKRGQELYPYAPVSILLKDRFETINRIKNIHAPLLILHGTVDRIVPAAHGKALYDAAVAPKHLILFKGIDHIDIPAPRVVKAITQFAKKNELLD